MPMPVWMLSMMMANYMRNCDLIMINSQKKHALIITEIRKDSLTKIGALAHTNSTFLKELSHALKELMD